MPPDLPIDRAIADAGTSLFDVTVARDRRAKDIRTHRCQLTPPDRRRQLGIPVTSPARAVLDCAPRVHNLRRFVNDALLSPWLTEDQLAETIKRHPRAAAVRAVFDDAPGVTHSYLEDKFLAFCKRFDIKLPELQVPMDGRLVDAFFREEGVIIEIDSWTFHKDRETFERDREKDAVAAANGLMTVRITDDRLEHAAAQEARRLQTILEARRS